MPLGFSRRKKSCFLVNASVVKHSFSMLRSVSRSLVLARLMWMGNQPRTIQVKLFLKDEFEAFEQGRQLFIAESDSNRSEAEFIGVKLTNLLLDIFFTEIEKVALTVSVAV